MRLFAAFILFSLGFCAIYPSAHAFADLRSSQEAIALPLTFETNLGQVDGRVRFLARGAHGNFFLTRNGVTFTAGRIPEQFTVDMWFPGALQTTPVSEVATGGVANYFTGKDRNRWIEHIPLYARARYPELYPGIDLVFHGSRGEMEYDFEVAPTANPETIRLGFRGAESMQLDPQGNLVLHTAHGALRFQAPRAYQDMKDGRHPVEATFRLSASGRVSFMIGKYDHSTKLIIDPVVTYATSFAASNSTQVSAVGIDAEGDLLFTGETYATDYPVAGDGKSSGGSSEQIVVTKLDPGGDAILYSTYIPSSNFNTATALAVGQDGSAYVAGITADPSFPVTSENLGGCTSFCNTGFVAKFDSDGAMVYSTMLDTGQVLPHAITVNSTGNAYVTGLATGAGLLTTPGAFQSDYDGMVCTSCSGAFYAELNTTGDHYVFASYFGTGELWGQAIALDKSGNVYIAGTTTGDVPFSGQLEAGIGQMFVAKFSPDGSHLLFGSNFGGGFETNHESVAGMAIGTDGTVYVAGNTDSLNFPYLATAERLPVGQSAAGTQIFAAAIDPTLTRLTYSTMLANGTANAAALDAKNNLWVAGQMGSDTIQTVNALESDGPGSGLIFEVGPTGQILTSTYFGGSNVPQVPVGIAVDSGGNVYIGGTTAMSSPLSTDDAISVGKDPILPPPTGTYGSGGVMLAKIAPDSQPQISLAGSLPYLYLRNVGTADLHISSIQLGGDLSTKYGNCGDTVVAGHSCALTVGDSDGKVAAGTVTINSNASPSSQVFTPPVAGQGAGGSIGNLLLLDLSQLHFPAQQSGTTSLPAPVKVWNIGAAPATLTSIQVGGSLIETHDCTPTLATGSYCTINVSWVPSHSGGSYIQVNEDGAQLPMIYAPGSFVQGPDPLYFSQQNMNFGNQFVGAAGLSHEVTVTNISNAPAALSSATIGGASEFAISGNSCTGQLAPHQSCAVTVSFTPTIDGSRTATLNLSGSSSSASIPLFASGEIASQVAVNPLQIGYDQTVIGSPSYEQPVTLTNNGSEPVTVSGISFSQPIFSETDTCTAPIPANGTCVIQVTAKPLQPGNFFGTMTIAFSGAATNQVLTISGVGYFPITTLVSSLDFGQNTTVGSASSSQYIEIANSMQSKPQAYTASVTDDFVVDTSKCPSPVPGFWGCPLYVTFKPMSPGLHTGILTLSFPGVSATETITLTGSSTGSTVPVDSVPASLDFGSVPLGNTSTQSIDITNSGQQLLHITGVSVSGTNTADFSAANGQCATVLPGEKCTLQISFHPSADIKESALLSIQDNAVGSPHSVSLTGSGIDPVAWATPASSATATTTGGGTATYSLSLTSSALTADTVKVACTGAPQYATCTPSPSTLSLTPGQKAAIAVTVATGSTTAASARAAAPFNRGVLAFVVFLPLLGISRRRGITISVLGAVVVIAATMSGCGGASTVSRSSTANTQVTAPGTYVLQVVATDGTFTQSQKITLIVQ